MRAKTETPTLNQLRDHEEIILCLNIKTNVLTWMGTDFELPEAELAITEICFAFEVNHFTDHLFNIGFMNETGGTTLDSSTLKKLWEEYSLTNSISALYNQGGCKVELGMKKDSKILPFHKRVINRLRKKYRNLRGSPAQLRFSVFR